MDVDKKPEEGGILLPNNVRKTGKQSIRQRNKMLQAHLEQLSDYLAAAGMAMITAHKTACEQYDALHLGITPAAIKARKAFETIAIALGPFAAPAAIEVQNPEKGGQDAGSGSEEEGQQVPPGREGNEPDSQD